MLIILPAGVVAGTLLLVLVFLLPVRWARGHAEESLYQMAEIMEDPEGSEGRKAIVRIKENFTDFLMVQNALEKVEGRSALEHAMNIFHHDLQDETTWLTEESLKAFLRRGTDGMYLKNYSKYWHGYLVYLKPLLMCMSWEHVEIFLVCVQIALLIATVALAFFRRAGWLGLGVVCAFLFMKPMRMWFSLAMSVCCMITLVGILVLLAFRQKIRRKKWHEEVFLLIGMATAYLDFLTYPVVTLGLPLCVWLVQDMEEESLWTKKLKKAFWVCACWVAGYVGMWGMKWVTAEVLCRTGTLRDAVWSVIFRTSPLDGYGSFFSGIERTYGAVLQQYDSVWYGMGFAAIAASALVSAVWCFVKARNTGWGATVACLAVTALFPFGWLVLTQNHTAIHCVFTFRIMGVTVMALWCIMAASVMTLRKAGRVPETTKGALGQKGNEGRKEGA